jgi:MFS family permease
MILEEIFNRFLVTLITFLPNLAGAIVLLLVGWIAGSIIGRLTKEFLKRLKIEEKITRGNKPLFKLSDILAVIFSWTVYLMFIREAVNVLALPTLVEVMGTILAFLPGLVGAIIVVVAGHSLAGYIKKHVEDSGVTYSDIIGNVLFFLIIYISIAIALPLVKIDPFLINAILLVIIASVGAGLAIAMGLGLKNTVAEMAKKYKRKLR